MSRLFIKCLDDAIKHKRISKKKGEEIRAALEARPNLDDEGALGWLDGKAAGIERDKRNAIRQAAISADRLDQAANHPKGAATGASAWLTRDVTGQAPYVPLEKQYRAILGRFHSKWSEAMSTMRTRSLGWSQDAATVKNVVRELHGATTGDARAAAYAKAFREIAEEARLMFNEAGGDIRLRQDWGSPQRHSRRLVSAVDKATWVADTLPELDPSRMYDSDGMPISPRALPAILESVYDNLTTAGAAGEFGPKAVKNRHMDPRILKFKDADAWIRYQGKYGEPDLFHGLTQHIDEMAREIAAMQTFGPNPDVTYQHLRAQAATVKGAKLNQMDHVYAVLTGRVNHPGSVRAAEVMSGIRSVLSSAKLGGAFLSSLSDWSFQGITARYNGLSFTRVAKNYFALMNPANEADRVFATKLGLVADAWIGRAIGTSRFTEEIGGRAFWGKMSETVMRASLLSSSTDAGRRGFGMEFMGALAERAGRSLAEVADENPALGRTLARYGFDASLWDDLRSIPRAGRDGVEYVSVEEIMRSGLDARRRHELATKLLNMVDSEADFAVPMPDARVRGHVIQGTRPGTIPGELIRMGTLWRSFALTALYTHIARGLYQGSPAKVGQYLASMFIATTAMGAVAYQAKQVAKGLDPMDWEDPGLWAAAAFQGGGMGIFGDFVQGSMRTRYGNSFLATMVGPAGAALEDIHALTLANVGAKIEGQDARLPRDMVQFLGRYTPGSTLWYTRAAFDRLVVDQLSQMADRSGAQRSFRAKENYWLQEAGVRHWWRRGKTTPDRPPNLAP